MVDNRRKVTHITTEVRELLLIHRVSPLPVVQPCVACGSDAVWITIPEAVSQTGRSARDIFWLVECQKLHFTETPEKQLLLCERSLTNLPKG